MAYVVRADWRAAEGSEADVLEAIRALTGPSRREPGNVCYQAYRDPTQPRVFRLFEVYEDQAAFQAHLDSDHFKKFGSDTALPLLDDRAIAFYETLE
jgi:quinol monooxygenase YgiN